ncbi:MAG: phage integrase central domain-containing protein [Betaproteobacteria bacterium]
MLTDKPCKNVSCPEGKASVRFGANASFEASARGFHAIRKVGWSDHCARRWTERLENDVFPWLGKLPLSPIGAPMLLQTLSALLFQPPGNIRKIEWAEMWTSPTRAPSSADGARRRCPWW